MVVVAARFKPDANKIKGDLKGNVKREAKLAVANPYKAREQFAGSAETAEKALRQLTLVSDQAQLFEGEIWFLMLQKSKATKSRDAASGFAAEQSCQVRMLKARIGVLKHELDSLEQKTSTDCDLEGESCKVVDAKDDINCSADGFCRETLHSYVNIRRNFDRLLLVVSKCKSKMFDRGVMALQQDVLETLRNAACGVQKLFVDALEVACRSISLIVGHLKCDELIRP